MRIYFAVLDTRRFIMESKDGRHCFADITNKERSRMMADKRMFTRKITDDDNFISMPSSAQALYFHLNQGADDDGFTTQIAMAMFKAHASEDDLRVLLAKNYVIRFESGVLVIKHWRMHNTLRKDRYTPTNYQEELELLGVKKNGAYTLNTSSEPWLPNGCQMVATDKYSIVENSIGQGSGSIEESVDEESNSNDVDNVDKSFSYMGGTLGKGVVILTDAQRDALLDELGIDAFNHYVEKLATFIITKEAKVANHYATIKKWVKEDSEL